MKVSEFEKQTSYCPLYLAWRIVDEARDYFRTDIPEGYARKLARRAEAVFAHQPFWARKASPRAGFRNREFILKFMRHWLAGVLAKEQPALFRQLPESFKIGHPLPEKPVGTPRCGVRTSGHRAGGALCLRSRGLEWRTDG